MFNFGASAVPQAQPPVVPQPPAQDPMQLAILQLIQGMGQHQQQGPDLAGLVASLHQPPRHLGASGGEITSDNPMGHLGGDPWHNGFFGANTSSATGSGRSPSAEQSYQASGFRPNVGTVTGLEPGGPFSQAPAPLGPNGVSGMIDPNAPNPYADQNWWTAMAKVNPKGWLPGQHVR